jgi:hypothetical protein
MSGRSLWPETEVSVLTPDGDQTRTWHSFNWPASLAGVSGPGRAESPASYVSGYSLRPETEVSVLT